MGMGYNKVIMMGNAVNVPELKTTPSGTFIASFSLAVNEANGTQFFKIVVTGKQAEYLYKHLRKGQPVNIVGKLHNNIWSDRNGYKHVETQIYAEEIDI